jgi:hypothetical protein
MVTLQHAPHMQQPVHGHLHAGYQSIEPQVITISRQKLQHPTQQQQQQAVVGTTQ